MNEVSPIEAEVTELSMTQSEIAAVVFGKPYITLPKDLYIPPDALRIFLEAFEGPLDLLLYLIKKQNIDILDIPVATITQQYMQYIELMKELQLELVAEYLVMAAMLAEIKSRLLLPRPQETADSEPEEDPRAELIRRLQEYERFKRAADELDALPRLERDIYLASADKPQMKIVSPPPQVDLNEILDAFRAVMERAKLYAKHHVEREGLSIRERMSQVLVALNNKEFTEFNGLFKAEEGRMGVVVTFIAILELIRQSMIELVQAEPFAPIYVRARG